MKCLLKPPAYKNRVSLCYLKKSPERLHSTLWRWDVFRLENWEWRRIYNISHCPSRVSVAQRSDHRCVDSGTLGSIPSKGYQNFRIYNYNCIKSSLHIKFSFSVDFYWFSIYKISVSICEKNLFRKHNLEIVSL